MEEVNLRDVLDGRGKYEDSLEVAYAISDIIEAREREEACDISENGECTCGV